MPTSTVEQTAPPRISCSPVNSRSDRQARGWIQQGLLLINSLSLDAPIVAASWLWCLALIYDTRIGVQNYLVLISVTWLAYSGDRLMDCLRAPVRPWMPPRHLFASKYFKPLMCVWSLVVLSSVCFLISHLTRSELVAGAGLVILLALYYLLCFVLPCQARGFLPRELLVGMFFSIATHFFVFEKIAHNSLYFAWTFFCFWGLCSLNCLLISRCEFRTDQQGGEVTYFTRHPRRRHHFSSLLMWYLCLQAVVCVIDFFKQAFPLFELSLLLSAGLLFYLDRSLIKAELKPVLADAALFFPCILLSVVL